MQRYNTKWVSMNSGFDYILYKRNINWRNINLPYRIFLPSMANMSCLSTKLIGEGGGGLIGGHRGAWNLHSRN